MTHKPTLTLASASPRRTELLKTLKVRFEVIAAHVTECEDSSGDPWSIAQHNAQIKGEWVQQQYRKEWVLAADTLVALEERIFNKPSDLQDAFAMLHSLSGKTHHVYTGIYLHTPHCHVIHCERTAVHFLPLTDAIIERYFQQVNPLDKSGSYAIQQGLGTIVSGYEGSFTNVMGLPMEYLEKIFSCYSLIDKLSN